MLVGSFLFYLLFGQAHAMDSPVTAKRIAYFDLVVNPAKYDGKLVSIQGYVWLDKEQRNTVFLSYDKNAMDIARMPEIFYVMDDEPEKRQHTFEGISGKYISLVAVYRHVCSDAPYLEKENTLLRSRIPGCLNQVSSVQPITVK